MGPGWLKAKQSLLSGSHQGEVLGRDKTSHFEPQAKNAGVRVELTLDAPDEMVPGDAGQLLQVFSNLEGLPE